MGLFNRPTLPTAKGSTGLDLHFAVVDVETTGLNSTDHRIIEIAIVIINARGQVLHEWHTLVNPGGGGVGPTAIHGVQEGWLAAAPSFEEIAGDIGALFAGRIAVAHNGKFDFDFIEAEFRRLGTAVRSDLTYLDTMTLAERLGLPRRLASLAAELGIAYFAHGALEDARTTARILAQMLPVIRPETFTPEFPVAAGVFPALPPTGRTVHREQAASLTQPTSLLAQALPFVPAQNVTGTTNPEASAAYVDLLERSLVDGYLSPQERQHLVHLAYSWGLAADDLANLHEEFLDGLLRAALEDRTVSKQERTEIEHAARWLGIEAVHLDTLFRRARARARAELDENRADVRGRTIVFTGRGMFSNSIREALCSKYGIKFRTSVTSECELVVIGTEDLANTAVSKAQTLGIRLLHEPHFWAYLGEKG